MADGFIRLPADGAGKALDADTLTVAGELVYRERDRISGAAATELAEVRNADAGATDHGLVTREAPPISPAGETQSSSALGVGSSVNLDYATIPSGKTAQLTQVVVSSTAACKWVVQKRDGAVLTTVATLFTGGIQDNPSFPYRPTHKTVHTLAYVDGDENWRVVATNLDSAAADVYATVEWDEV